VNSPFSVGKILPESPAENAGILSGDKILKVNGHPITSFQEMNSYFESDEDREVVLELQREGNAGQKFEKTIVLDQFNKIGISVDQKIDYKVKVYSLPESLKLGVTRFWSSIIVQFKVLGRTLGLLVGQKKKTLSGPIGISAAFGSFSFSRLASLTSLYIALVIMLNLLPLPKSAMLEVIPLGYEALTRKPFSYNSFRIIRKTSIAFLFALMMWQFVIDIVRLFS
jgi:regulator of sigma E protease